MKVPRRALEEEPPDERQGGVADPAVLPGHGPGNNRPAAARQPAAHHQLVALAELLQEALHVREVVAVVRIPEHDPLAQRGFDAAAQGAAVALFPHVNHSRPQLLGDGHGPVGAAVVGHQDFPAHACPVEALPRLLNAGGKRFRLVQARHQDG